MSTRSIGAAAGIFALGVLAGALGSMWYSQERFGRELLQYVRQDAEQNLRNLEKMKELLESDESASAVRFVDNQMEMARLVIRSTGASIASESISETPER